MGISWSRANSRDGLGTDQHSFVWYNDSGTLKVPGDTVTVGRLLLRPLIGQVKVVCSRALRFVLIAGNHYIYCSPPIKLGRSAGYGHIGMPEV